MFRTNVVAGIGIDGNEWKLAIGIPNLETGQIKIIHVGTYSTLETLKEDLSKFGVSHVNYSISSQYAGSYATPLINNASSLDAQCQARHITPGQHIADYFSLGNSSILTAMTKNNLGDIEQFQPALNLSCTYSITHSDVVLTYSLLRNYSDKQNLCLGLLHFELNHISLAVIQNGSVKALLWKKIKSDHELTVQIVELLKTGGSFCEQKPVRADSQEPTSKAYYDLIFGAGECTLDHLISVKNNNLKDEVNIREVDLLDSIRNQFTYVDNQDLAQQTELEHSSHRYSVPIAAITMHFEKLGIDLAHAENQLGKKLRPDASINIDENILDKAFAKAVGSAKTIIPLLAKQKYLVLTVAIVSLCFNLYRYNSYNNELISLEEAYSKEKSRENSLIGIKTDYEIAQKRNKVKNDRINAIKNIQKTQMLTSTILNDLQSLLYQSQFRDLVAINSLTISGSSIKVSGEAIDKIGAVAFVNKIQQNEAYDDVIPAYKSLDNVKCGYELSTKFIGYVPTNEILLPKTDPLQVVSNTTNSNK